MKRLVAITALLLARILAGSALAGEEPKLPFAPQRYVCYRAPKALTIDGVLDEAIWTKAPWTVEFRDIEGELKPLPRHRTRAKMLWDDDYFYVAAELEEPHVWANLTKRDSVIFYDNDFEVFIDPDGDTHHYYEFEMNALNTVWDLFLYRPYRDGVQALFHWDINGLKTGVSVKGTLNNPSDKDEGWTLEIAFPWAVLRECAPESRPPKAGEQWRVNFSRVEWRTEIEDGRYVKVKHPDTGKPLPEDNWVWSPQGVVNMHYPEMWAFVQFSNEKAGAGKDAFAWNPEEDVKWALRRIYYAQREHAEKHGRFSDVLKALDLEELSVKGWKRPKIHVTPRFYEATVERADGKAMWRITADGRVARMVPTP